MNNVHFPRLHSKCGITGKMNHSAIVPPKIVNRILAPLELGFTLMPSFVYIYPLQLPIPYPKGKNQIIGLDFKMGGIVKH